MESVSEKIQSYYGIIVFSFFPHKVARFGK